MPYFWTNICPIQPELSSKRVSINVQKTSRIHENACIQQLSNYREWVQVQIDFTLSLISTPLAKTDEIASKPKPSYSFDLVKWKPFDWWLCARRIKVYKFDKAFFEVYIHLFFSVNRSTNCKGTIGVNFTFNRTLSCRDF